ncbi:MAG: phage capsid protein [Actinomycetota bacterium]
MSTQVPNNFIELFSSEVKAAYQREGSLLRQTVRERSGVPGERIYFPKLGKGQATSKARHAEVTPMNLDHERVYADMEDYYAPEYIDDLDQAKTNISLRAEYARASAYALGRTTDSLIIDALDSAPSGNRTSGDISLDSVAGIHERLTKRDVPMDRERYAVLSPEALNELLQVSEAASSDFTRDQILVSGQAPTFWMGFNWMTHTGLPDGVKGYFFHRPSVGLGINQDIQTSIDRVPERVAWLVNSWMSMGSVLIEEDGVEVLETS